MKILLVCVHFHSSFGWSIERALLRAGHEVSVFDYRQNPFQRIRGLRRAYTSLRMPQRLLDAAKAFRPELVFLAKGEMVAGEVVARLKREFRCRVINWFPDPRPFHYSHISDQLGHLDLFFSKNITDLDRLNLLGLENGRFLLHCADRELHTGLETSETELQPYSCDLAFVGSYYPYRDMIVSQLLDFNIRIWGAGWSGSKAAKKRGAIVGREARSMEQTMVFRGATANLNTHHYDDIGSLNQRVFDIAGSGGCQIMDGYRKVEDVFSVPDEVELFHSAQELQDKVAKLIASPDRARKMGERTRTKTAAAHTYDHRIAEILNLVEKV
ncbi:MAG TPA: glycosyltransferase [Acidobacteriota bacterium]|nr:glycosyltransferase [Acidobacteriota bacterium]